MILRQARPADIAAIFAVTRESFAGLAKTHYSKAQVDGWMDGAGPESYREGVDAGRIHVAEIEGAVVGYVDAEPGEITRLFVLPGAAGRGIGARLLEIGVRLARRGNSGRITVEALRNAVGFYAKFDFVTVGHGFSSHGTAETPPIEIVRMELVER